jgi:hypothetical protein
MNLAFNELSLQPLVDDDNALKDFFISMIKTYNLAKEKYGFANIVFPNDLSQIRATNSKLFYDWVNALSASERSNILTFVRKPFTNDILRERTVDIYSYYFENSTLAIEQTYCYGMSLAHITNTATISLFSNVFWNQCTLEFVKVNSETYAEEYIGVPNICDLQSIDCNEFKEFAESIQAIELIISEINPDTKHVHFRDDHGKDVLTNFANRIKQSGYVISILNSLPFNRHTSLFIRRVYSNGLIEIVLHWEDDGYGMVIQTTGRNYRETYAIAQILRDRFDR